MCRLTTEIGQNILKAHIQKAGLPADTQYMAPDLSALGFTACLDTAVWGTKERQVTTHGDDGTTVRSYDSTSFLCETTQQAMPNGTRPSVVFCAPRACIEQNISRLKFNEIRNMGVLICVLWELLLASNITMLRMQRDPIMQIGKDLVVDDASCYTNRHLKSSA